MARHQAQQKWFNVVLLQSSGLELKRLPMPIEGRYDAREKAEELNEHRSLREKEAGMKWDIDSCSPPPKKKRLLQLRPFPSRGRR